MAKGLDDPEPPEEIWAGIEAGLVVSWKANKRQLTVVGAHDLEEIADLITHFQTGTPEA